MAGQTQRGRVTLFIVVSPHARGRPSASDFDPAALARTYGVSFPTTRSQQLAEGVSGVLSLWHFRLAGSRSLSIGGWQPNESGAVFGWRRRFLFDVFRGRRLRRWRGPMGSASPRPDRNSWLRGSPACFLSGIFGWRDRGLYPLAGGSRINLARSLGGAADFCLTSFEVGGFGAGADLWGQLPHDPIATAG